MKIIYLGGKQSGLIGLLTTISMECNVICVVAYDSMIANLCNDLKIPVCSSVKDELFINSMTNADALICVHGREILSREILDSFKYRCVNLHPCLYKYKGSNPIRRLLNDFGKTASVGAFYMTEKIDEGELITEKFLDVSDILHEEQIYNRLYPVYVSVLIDVIKKMDGRC